MNQIRFPASQEQHYLIYCHTSRVAQWKRAGPKTQRSVDRNYALLLKFFRTLFIQMSKTNPTIFSIL